MSSDTRVTHIEIVCNGDVIGRIDLDENERENRGLRLDRVQYILKVTTGVNTQDVYFQWRFHDILRREVPFWIIHHALIVLPSYNNAFE